MIVRIAFYFIGTILHLRQVYSHVEVDIII